MKKIGRIILGWWRVVFPSKLSKEIKDMARKRKSVCKYCSYNRLQVCQVCGCVISAKVLIEEEECPKGKWPEWWRPIK